MTPRSSRDRLVFTVEEAARLLGVARSTMYETVRSGEVAWVRIGRRVFVTAPTIAALTGVTPPSPAELVARRAADAAPVQLRVVSAEPTPAPATSGDAQRPLFG